MKQIEPTDFFSIIEDHSKTPHCDDHEIMKRSEQAHVSSRRPLAGRVAQQVGDSAAAEMEIRHDKTIYTHNISMTRWYNRQKWLGWSESMWVPNFGICLGSISNIASIHFVRPSDWAARFQVGWDGSKWLAIRLRAPLFPFKNWQFLNGSFTQWVPLLGSKWQIHSTRPQLYSGLFWLSQFQEVWTHSCMRDSGMS